MHFVVFELKNKGFTDNTIQQIIEDIFSRYEEIDFRIYTKFPHNLEFPKGSTQENQDKFYKDLKDYIDSLTYQDRIVALCNYFDKKTFQVKFIFRVIGIKGKENLEIDDIEIYNPFEKQLALNDKSDSENDELFGLSTSQKSDFQDIYNIAIKVNAIDTNDTQSAKHRAIYKAHAFFDCFVSRNFYIKTKIIIDTTQYLILSKENKRIGDGYSMNDPFISYIDSITMTKQSPNLNGYLQYYEKLTTQKELIEIDNQITRSLAWRRRALETINYNEAILWHWVSIENLFNSKNGTTKSIFHFAPNILTQAYTYEFMRKIYMEIKNKAFPFNDYDIPLKAINFIDTMPKDMDNKEFIKYIKKLCELLNKETFFYEKLQNFIKIFEDKKEFKAFIENYKKQIEQKIIFLYRLRNKITHHAMNEYNETIVYYKNFASYINTILICYFIDTRVLRNKYDNDEIINYGVYEYNKMLLNLEKYGVDSIINPKEYE